MINRKIVLDKMRNSFPSWTDIKRKTEQADGGKILSTLTEEIVEINHAIEEYKKDFFIEFYRDKHDKIIDYLYKSTVGDLKGLDFEMIFPEIEVTEDSKLFRESDISLAYYDGKNIILKEKDLPSIEEITYSINSNIIKSNLEKFHVWNQFDEFALVMGIKRLKDETNIELLKRIELEGKRPPSSSTTGLKNSITNVLKSKGYEIENDDIKIEGIGENNLNIEIDDKKIIDIIMEVNKDVYKEKKWDLDSWEYDFDSTDYLPLNWDEKIDKYQDGVAFGDSLKAQKSRTDSLAKVEVTMLNKSEKKVKEYIKDINIEDEISIPIYKYSDEIKPLNATFRVEAKNIKDITHLSTKLIGYNLRSRYKEILLDKVIKDKELLNITDTLNFTEGDRIKVSFLSENRETMEIRELYTYEDGTKKELFDKRNLPWPMEYSYTSSSLLNSKVKFLANSSDELFFKDNVIDKESGITQENKENKSTIKIDLNGMQNEELILDYKTENVPVHSGFIKTDNFQRVSSNSYISNGVGSLEFKINANSFSFNSSDEIVLTVNDESVLVRGHYEHKESKVSRELTVKIRNENATEITISNLNYKSFDLKIDLEEDKMIYVDNKMILPNIKNNSLTISFKSKTVEDFYIKRILIGYETKDDIVSFDFEWRDTFSGLFIESDCKVSLFKDSVLIDEDFKTRSIYTPIDDEATVKLDLSEFVEIDKIYINEGRIIEDINNGKKDYILYLNNQHEISQIEVHGLRKSEEEIIDFHSAFGIVPSRGDKLYVTHNEPYMITIVDDKEKKEHINEDVFKRKYNHYEFITESEDIESIFSINHADSVRIRSNICNSFFKKLYVWTKNKRTHIANNMVRCFSAIEEDIEIVNNFMPMITSNSLFYYKIHETPKEGEKYTVLFTNGLSESLGRKKIRVVSDIDFKESTSYKMGRSFLNKDYVLSDYIFLNRNEKVIDEDGEKNIDIAEYILEPGDEYELIYSKKRPTDNYDQAIEYFGIEKVHPHKDGFNKLKYSNIDEIIYIGIDDWDGTYNMHNQIPDSSFHVMKREGIIVWEKEAIESESSFVLVYTIKIPSRIRIPLEKLYKVQDIPIEAYDLVERKTIDIKVSDSSFVDFKDITNKEFTDVRLKIDNTNISGRQIDNGIEFRNNNSSESIVLDNGYYYVDGKEYYLYNSPKHIPLSNFTNIEMSNVKHTRESLVASKSSINYIQNPQFELGDHSLVFHKDYRKEDVKDLNYIGRLSSCDCFNRWTIVNGGMDLVSGINGLGLEFIPNLKDGFAYIKLPNSNKELNISMFASSTLNVWIGTLNDYNMIEKDIELNRDETYLNGKYEGDNKFLVVTGAGVIDDIIIKEKEIELSNHIKNIDRLNINFNEYEDLPLNKTFVLNEDLYLDNLEVSHDNFIRTTSNIGWRKTNIYSLNKNKDWTNTYNENLTIRDNSIISKSMQGFLRTRPFHLEHFHSIKNLTFNINKIELESLRGFKVEVFTGRRIDSVTRKCYESNSNFGSIDGSLLENFVSFKITFPSERTINSFDVFAEYIETEQSIKPIEFSNGTATTKIFDIGLVSDIKLSSINVSKDSDISNVEFRVRAAKDENKGNYVWTEWVKVELDQNNKVINEIIFKEHKLIQIDMFFKSKTSKLNVEDCTVEIYERGTF